MATKSFFKTIGFSRRGFAKTHLVFWKSKNESELDCDETNINGTYLYNL